MNEMCSPSALTELEKEFIYPLKKVSDMFLPHHLFLGLSSSPVQTDFKLENSRPRSIF